MQPLFEYIYASPIGQIKIVGDVHSIRALSFIESFDNESFDKASSNKAPRLDAVASPAVMQQCMDELTDYFNGTRTNFTVPIQQAGTDFQQKVWKELCKVPYAKTMSYAALAKKLGDPKVIRAAATANGKNKIAIIVPCHRVIGSDNNLTGYAWGLYRKKWLLEHEFKNGLGVQTLFA